jgi:hypothetical protein
MSTCLRGMLQLPLREQEHISKLGDVRLVRACSCWQTCSRRARTSASPSLVKRTIAQRDWIGSMILLLWLHASANLGRVAARGRHHLEATIPNICSAEAMSHGLAGQGR